MAAAAAASSLTQCQQVQQQLEEAISSVMKAEQLLRDNTREVRSELQSSVSRQQEALRSRELWLLGQIELLEQVKTETLQQQLSQLQRLRGQFDVIALQLQNNSSNNLNNQLTACMEKLSTLSLTPEETPEMSFCADARSLRQAITSFGCITAQLVEGVSQSPAQRRGSVKSCPVAAKKQRMEAGALSDWLLDTHPGQSSATTGYQSSKNPQDWLLSQKEVKTSCPLLTSMDFLQAWGQLRDLEAWLLHDHAPVGRERTDSSCSSSFSIEKIDESELTSGPEEEEEEEGAELGDWLVTPPVGAAQTASDGERWRQVLKPFQSGWSSGEWLSESERPADCASCRQTGRPLEIENLGRLKCLKTPPPSGPASPAAPAAALEAWLQRAVPDPQTCRANELCSAYSRCVCEENCGGRALQRWLLQQEGRDKNGVALSKKAPPTAFHAQQEHKVQAILEAWLHPSTSSSSSSSSLSAWVAPEEEQSSSSSSSSPFQRPLDADLWVLPAPQQEDKWLLKKRNQERLLLPTVCDLFSCMKVGGDKEKWLHRAPVQM